MNEKTTTDVKEIPFFDRPAVRVVILILIIVVGYFVYSYITTQNKCSDKIIYQPATESVVTDSAWTTKQGESEHYSYAGRKFKTRSEAMSYCANL